MNSKVFRFLGVFVVVAGIVGLIAAKGTGTKSKVGCIDTNVLWSLMPEKQTVDEKLKKQQEEFMQYYKSLEKDFGVELDNFFADSANMSDLIKEQTRDKLMKMSANLNEFPEKAEADLQKSQNELYAPIRLKMQDAIDKVASREGYDVVMDIAFGNIVYLAQEEDNLLGKVKTELGLE